MAHFYFLDGSEPLVIGAQVVLTGDEGRHAATVSRLRVGESVRVGDGLGTIAVGTVTGATKDTLTILVNQVDVHARELPQLTLIQALAKTDRDERAVEMSTELGIDVVIPWLADRSVSRWDSTKAEKGRLRWESIAREASKQSIRAHLPLVDSLATTKDICSQFGPGELIVLDPTGHIALSDVVLRKEQIALVVGPEGGLSPAELELFAAAGAQIATLGRNVLRTSTAGPAALAVLNSRLGRL
jgi:16S rRNA (uracil1498-N3)-methyltransferase